MNMSKQNKPDDFLATILLWFFLGMGVLSVLYFSWISSPKLSINSLMPEWIGRWADQHANFNFRTAVPLCFLGSIISFVLLLKQAKLKIWVLSWIVLFILVIIAELGQLLLPMRVFDINDILWGGVGAFIPLALGYFIILILNNNRI